MKTPFQNNKIPLFDLHCDTLLELFRKNEDIYDNNLHISLKKAENFSPYVQILAVWSDASLSNDEAFINYKNVVSYAQKQGIHFKTKASDVIDSAFFLAVEDARILNNNLDRLNALYNDGVRFLTLNWSGQTVIGGGWDTDFGLTAFGKNTLMRCFELGIISDISHSSIKASYESIELAKLNNKPIIASHSNSFAVCNHKRNLTDELFCELVNFNSLVGISLASEHLSKNTATIDDIIKHIYHYLSLGGENIISLGCDFDGVNILPIGINSICDLNLLYSRIVTHFGTELSNKIFFENAYNFVNKNLA